MAAAGLTLRPDLLLAASAVRDNKLEMDKLVEDAMEAAGATAAAPTLAQYKSAACIKVATDTWYVVGAIA